MSLNLLQTVQELRGLFRDRGLALPAPGLFGFYGLYAAVLFAILTLGGQAPTLPLDHATLRTRTILAIGLATAAPTVVTCAGRRTAAPAAAAADGRSSLA
jgi:hypothetical protein